MNTAPPKPSSPAASPAIFFVAGVTMLMTALAAGALWSVLALFTGRTLAPFALVVGALLGWMMGPQRLGGHWWSAVLGAVLTALASLYAAYLMATADIAMLLGLPMRSTLPRIGPEMALAVAWARASVWELVVMGVGCMVAATLAWRGRRR